MLANRDELHRERASITDRQAEHDGDLLSVHTHTYTHTQADRQDRPPIGGALQCIAFRQELLLIVRDATAALERDPSERARDDVDARSETTDSSSRIATSWQVKIRIIS